MKTGYLKNGNPVEKSRARLGRSIHSLSQVPFRARFFFSNFCLFCTFANTHVEFIHYTRDYRLIELKELLCNK